MLVSLRVDVSPNSSILPSAISLNIFLMIFPLRVWEDHHQMGACPLLRLFTQAFGKFIGQLLFHIETTASFSIFDLPSIIRGTTLFIAQFVKLIRDYSSFLDLLSNRYTPSMH